MVEDLTPAVARVLSELAPTISEEHGGAISPRLLLALFDEEECRAALLLRQQSVTAAQILARWPGLGEGRPITTEPHQANGLDQQGSATRTSALEWDKARPLEDVLVADEVQRILNRAGRLLSDFPRPMAMATEHLLLALVGGDDTTSHWLRERGFKVDDLLATLRGQLGVETAPLAVNFDEDNRGDSSGPFNEHGNVAGTGNKFPVAPASPVPQASLAPQASLGVARALDAAANRAMEGLRVLEDSARFVSNDAWQTARLKDLRHDLRRALARFPRFILAARDVPGDVGTPLTTAGEARRESVNEIEEANFHRVQESLRSLEEFGKLVDVEASAAFKQLRYRSYDIHQTGARLRAAQQSLANGRLCVLIDGSGSLEEFRRLVGELIEAGVPMLQLRDKQMDDRELQGRAGELMRIANGTPTRVIINDRPDLAAIADAHGVHVGQDELSVQAARRVVGPDKLIGLSTHSLQQAQNAVSGGADYIGVGPMFPSRTKAFDHFPGLDFARDAATEVSLPGYAIGGITLENLQQVLATGIHGVAVGTAITAAEEPGETAQRFLQTLDIAG